MHFGALVKIILDDVCSVKWGRRAVGVSRTALHDMPYL
jgi:hypothetical protein